MKNVFVPVLACLGFAFLADNVQGMNSNQPDNSQKNVGVANSTLVRLGMTSEKLNDYRKLLQTLEQRGASSEEVKKAVEEFLGDEKSKAIFPNNNMDSSEYANIASSMANEHINTEEARTLPKASSDEH